MSCVFKFFLLLIGLASYSVYGQETTLGKLPVTNYTSKDYKAAGQNMAVTKDNRGVLYFANKGDVLSFDGLNWVRTPVCDGDFHSLYTGMNGVVYVGAYQEFGFLTTDSKGTLVYQSISINNVESKNIGGGISHIVELDNEMYFQSDRQVFIWNNEELIEIPFKDEVKNIFHIHNKLYVRHGKNIISEIKNHKVWSIENSAFLNSLTIYDMVEYKEDSTLIVARSGLYISSKNNLQPIPFLVYDKEGNGIDFNEPTDALCTKNGNVLVSDVANGALFISKRHVVEERFNKEYGIADNALHGMEITDEGVLFLATNYGISAVNLESISKKVTKEDGIEGAIERVLVVDDRVVSIGVNGCFIYSSKDSLDKFFNVFPGESWGIAKVTKKNLNGDFLIASSLDGLYKVKDNFKASEPFIYGAFDKVWETETYNGLLFVAKWPVGLALMREKSDGWVTLADSDIDFKASEFEIDKHGNVWVGSLGNGLLKIDKEFFYELKDFDNHLTLFSENLPEGIIEPFLYEEEVYFTTYDGIFQYDQKTKEFERSTKLDGYQINEFNKIHINSIDYNGRLWLTLGDDVTQNIKATYFINGQWHEVFLDQAGADHAYSLKFHKNIGWLGGAGGLYTINTEKITELVDININISTITRDDSLIYGGAMIDENGAFQLPNSSEFNYTFDFSHGDITFKYSVNSFINSDENKYSFQLEGYKKEWSQWSPTAKMNYTNLPEGDYVFKVKAKNVVGKESAIVEVPFTILPPWYRAWWFYVLVIFFGIVILYFLYLTRTKALRKRQEELEQTVEERTAELVKQKEVVEVAHKEITDSINYAERIQRSFLATDSMLDENLKDYFVFFQPKDVVSGDFYWAGHLDNGNFAVVNADSTGHGVPGAIMSILNISSIEKAVEQGLSEPSEIFNETRKTIIDRLKKDGSPEGGKDGMDASIVCFDFKNAKMIYTAANNPIWVIRDKEIIQIKPDKIPVGKHDNDGVSFTQGEFELKKGDQVYTLTDGYQDQFGGPKGKKFMIKKMREYVLSISHLSMQEQYQKLDEVFSNWKADLEQVDDVCVIGIRV